MLSVSVLPPLPVTVPGANAAVTPAGNVLTENPTVPAKPFCAAMVTVYPALEPAATLWAVGVAPNTKSGGGVTISVMFDVWLRAPLVAVIVKG